MIGRPSAGARRTSIPTNGSEPSPGTPRTWAELAGADGISTSSVHESFVPAVEALVDEHRLPTTSKDCAAIIYWCSAHGARRVLDRLVDEWPAEVKTLRLSGNAARAQLFSDYTRGEIEWTRGAFEKTACNVLERLLARDEQGLQRIGLNHLAFDAGDLLRLAHAIGVSPSLVEISSVNYKPRRDMGDLKTLLISAGANPSLRCLRLHENLSDDEGVAAALASVIVGGRVETLELNGARLSADAAETLGRALASPRCQVGTLKLIDCLHDDSDAPELLLALKQNTSIRVLDLSNTDLGAGAADPRHLLDFNGKLTDLRLSWDKLERNACAGLGRMLARNPALVSLDLSCNHLSELGLVTGLPERIGLRHLDLRRNGLQEANGAILGRWLEKSPLESLNVSCNPLENEGVASLLEAVKSGRSLVSLDLRSVRLSSITADGIAALEANRGLTRLDLRGNPMLNRGIAPLFEALHHHAIELLISGDELPQTEYRTLAAALSGHSGIKSLTIKPGAHDEALLLDELAAVLDTNHTLTHLKVSATQGHVDKSPADRISRARAKIDWILKRNAGLRGEVQAHFANFALKTGLPLELGARIRSELEDDNEGLRALGAMRRTVQPFFQQRRDPGQDNNS